MPGFVQQQTEDRRLSILLLLVQSSGGQCNEALLHSALSTFGHAPSFDQVKSDLAWLAEQGLVETHSLAGLMVAAIKARGEDVAAGRAVVPGVQRPSRL